MSKPCRIMVIDDEPEIVQSICNLLQKRGYEVDGFDHPIQALNTLQRNRYDIVVLDFKMPNINGLEMIERIKELYPETRILLMTAYSSIPNAVEAMKKGAGEYISKPFDWDELEVKIKELGARKQKRKRGPHPQEYTLLGNSRKMTLLNEQIKKIAKTSATVLIHGESGTGKELVARQIHMQSPRNAEPFIAINMAAIPENLIESEFFGHRKGSFTGADNDYQGKFLASHEGTLFLDEISEIPLTFQAKLLRVLQDYSIQPIGTTDSIKINSRFLAATNKNLPELVASSQFREDLYYRLNIIELQVPPFRERLEDLELLVEHFIKKHGTTSMSAPSEFLDILRAYSWPGNVRELENVIHRCIVLSEGDVLDKFDLPESISGLKPKKETPLAEVAYRQLQEGKSLGEIERDIIIKAIHEANGNKTNAAKLLKITRRKLYSRMEKHGIEL